MWADSVVMTTIVTRALLARQEAARNNTTKWKSVGLKTTSRLHYTLGLLTGLQAFVKVCELDDRGNDVFCDL